MGFLGLTDILMARPVFISWPLMVEHTQHGGTHESRSSLGRMPLCFLRTSEEVAAAFLSLPEEHSDNRNGILKRAAQINGAVIKQMRPIS